MAAKSQRESEQEVRSWGFSRVITWTDTPNYHYTPHSHEGLTTHLILKGEITIRFPEDAQPEKKTFGAGERLDVEAGREHEVWVGPEGCTMVIGE
ncbi:hypothetical protein ONS95_004306 [Cadophora gregata]|uniref:uncharacterized protein n=1 Tax=Cadophora gregata TaxID=51156 RepID=UPI0026DD6964|nr:uncharacterized protein ONS95_004306 [Cadophora gregata]KAK0105311.1 hypothetical protein ONS96_004707 [Cadophora gregata f. sp. sojae]KAK0105789.1 hypothetical protein ONS95_004306 [Cadophora gregata]